MGAKNGLLLVAHPALMLRRVGGMTVLERQLWTAQRAGLERLVVGLRRPDEQTLSELRLPPGLELLWSQREADAETECPTPYLAISGDHFVRPETLRYVAERDYPSAVDLVDAAGDAVIQAVPARDEKVVRGQRQPLPHGASCVVNLPAGRAPIVGWLMASGAKSADGFMARHFDRHISLAVSKALLETRVTPNHMTLVSTAIGLTGASCFAAGDDRLRVAGALLVLLHSVIDGCDGELARMRFQESSFGADLDFWGDNLVHVALFSCLAYGHMAEHPVALLLGAAAVAGTIGSALLSWRKRLARRRDPSAAAPSTKLRRLEDALEARDFIYLLVALAYAGRTYEFLWATGIGTALFFALMLHLRRQDHETPGQPHPAREGQAGDPPAGDGSGHQHVHSGR